MYRVNTQNCEDLKDFLNTVDTEWVTFIGTKDGVMLIMDSSELFALIQLESDRSASDKDVIFRVKKDFLKLLLLEKTLELIVTEDKVNMTFIGDRNRRSVTIAKHTAYTTTFSDKLNLVSKCSAARFDASSLYKLYQVSRTLGSFVEVENDVACVISRDGTRVYKENVGIPDLCLSAFALRALYTCGKDWGCVQNYVFAIRGKFAVLVTQCRGSGVASYDLKEANSQGSAAIATLDFSDVLYMLSKLRLCEVEINLRTSEAVLKKDGIDYSVSLGVEGLQINQQYEGSIKINSKVFVEILPKLSISKLSVYVKKSFYKLCCGDIIILCK